MCIYNIYAHSLFHSQPTYVYNASVVNGQELCAYIIYMDIAPFHCQPSYVYYARVENEKGLCAYIIYMHIAPFIVNPPMHIR